MRDRRRAIDLHLIVRLVHVLAATAIVGGAALAWMLCTGRSRLDGAATARICERYEWLFWGSAAVIVATGVGNLGAFGRGLPGPDTAWGVRLQVKVAIVLLLLAFSVARTFTVARIEAGNAAASRAVLRNLYAATVLLGIAIVGFAEGLAHA